MKMKKLILLFAAAALLLAGCGGNEAQATPVPETETPTPAPTAAPEPERPPEGLPEGFAMEDRTEEIRSRVAQAAEGVSMQDEQDRVEALYREYSDYVGQANTQTDANLLSQWPYLVWDTELNSLWGRLKDALSADVMEELRNEEINWIRFRDEAAQEAVRSFEGGSIYPMLYTLEQAALTRNRACFLASMLSRAVNEPFELPPRGVCGQYLDTGGTAAVYKRLVIAAGMESGYTATLFVSGTGTLEGEAEPAGEGKIAFTSYDGKVEGEIVYGWTGASFTVTRSDGGPFGLGEVYILPTAL